MPTVFLRTYFDADWASYIHIDPLLDIASILLVILFCGPPKD
jgi:hypothetical protein